MADNQRTAPFEFQQNPNAVEGVDYVEGHNTIRALVPADAQLLDFYKVLEHLRNFLRCHNYFPCLHAGKLGGKTRVDLQLTVAGGDPIDSPNLVAGTNITLTPSGSNITISASGGGDVTAASNLTDHAIVRGNGGAKGVQTSGVTIDDNNNIAGAASLTMPERSGAALPVDAGFGQYYVVDSEPNRPRFLDDAGGDHGILLDSDGSLLKRLPLEVSRADLNALGASTAGYVDFADALPAGAQVLSARALNGGTAFTSSGGTVLSLNVTVVAAGQTASLTGTLAGMQTADRRTVAAGADNNAAGTALPYVEGYTPSARFAVTGAGVTLGNLTDGDDGILIELFYTEQP